MRAHQYSDSVFEWFFCPGLGGLNRDLRLCPSLGQKAQVTDERIKRYYPELVHTLFKARERARGVLIQRYAGGSRRLNPFFFPSYNALTD